MIDLANCLKFYKKVVWLVSKAKPILSSWKKKSEILVETIQLVNCPEILKDYWLINFKSQTYFKKELSSTSVKKDRKDVLK